ncbi:MAG TPA: SNF2-related protein [Armatimonadota bacterium]|nr:SNF2-related protein [Armatimonadota bacterium]
MNEAFASRAPHAQELAEQAVREWPREHEILYLAAVAALLKENPERCLRHLKRIRRDYVVDNRHHLLRAIALAQQGVREGARELLRKVGVRDPEQAIPWFLADPSLWSWLVGWLRRIRAYEPPRAGRGRGKRHASARSAKRSSSDKAPSAPAAEAPALLPEVPDLPRHEPEIPIRFELLNANAIMLDRPAQGEEASDWYRLRAEFTHLSLLREFDELLCLPLLHQVQTYWYQVETVRKVLRSFRGRVLLADEVGLGKTIEAGMVLKEYLLRGMVQKVLILTPASLVGQWQEEMATKFDIPCATSYDSLLRSDPDAFWAQPRVIASIATARRQEHFARLTQQAYDLVIVDEAHHLKSRTTHNYRLVDALQKRFLLLLSATPVQNSLVELYNLLTLLKPGIFKTEREFRGAYVTPGKPRLPVNRERMHELMRDVMVRNTRALVDVRLPARHAVTLRLEATGEEQSCYQGLDQLVRELHASAPGHHRLALHHLLSAAGSSPNAAAAALERSRVGKDERWRALSERYRRIARGAKEAALLDLLRRNPQEKKMVFVHHRETLRHLEAVMREQGISFARFEGSLSGPDKDAAIEEFRERVPVLLSTQSGGEGRNVQFCNTLINFDLPWNPMAIEQRIGRLHRIGQTRDVFIFNLAARDTVESQMLQILDEKINMFELVVGEIDAILGELDERQDFADIVLTTWLETTERGRPSAFADLGERMVKAKQQYEAIKELDTALFGDDFETV